MAAADILFLCARASQTDGFFGVCLPESVCMKQNCKYSSNNTQQSFETAVCWEYTQWMNNAPHHQTHTLMHAFDRQHKKYPQERYNDDDDDGAKIADRLAALAMTMGVWVYVYIIMGYVHKSGSSKLNRTALTHLYTQI